MSNTYRALTPAAQAAFSVGVFEAEFTPSEEKDWLDSGLLELVPRTYRVLSDNFEVPKDELFERAYLKEPESALIGAGHIERVDEPEEPTEDEPAEAEPEVEAVAEEPTKEGE